MAEPFKFSHTKIDDHIQKVGFDIRPVIEHKLDREKLFAIGKELVDKYPNLYESLVQSPTDFHIRKKFIFPGKGEIDFVTLGVAQRGPVFIFPRKLSIFDDEIELDRVEDIVLECVKIFRHILPEKKLLRVGLVNEYVFNTGLLDSIRLICERFTKLSGLENGEIRLRINRPADDYNRNIEIQAVRKLEAVPEIPDRRQTKNYGVKVMVDFNNLDVSRDLDNARILSVLHDAREFNENELYAFLNGE